MNIYEQQIHTWSVIKIKLSPKKAPCRLLEMSGNGASIHIQIVHSYGQQTVVMQQFGFGGCRL